MKRLALTTFLTLTLMVALPAILQAEAKSKVPAGQYAPGTKPTVILPKSITDEAPPQVSLWQVYANPERTFFTDVKRTFNSGFIMAGLRETKNDQDSTLNDLNALVYKLRPDGTLSWQNSWFLFATGQKDLSDIFEDNKLRIFPILAGGFTIFSKPAVSGDILATRLNHLGSLVSQKGCALDPDIENYQFKGLYFFQPYSFTRTTDNGYLTIGYSAEYQGDVLVKLDHNCKEQWFKKVSDLDIKGFRAPLLKSASGYISGVPNTLITNSGVVSLSPEGNKMWDQYFSDDVDVKGIARTKDEGSVVVGARRMKPGFFVMKVNSNGGKEWQRSHEVDVSTLPITHLLKTTASGVKKVKLYFSEQSIVETQDGGYAVVFALPPANIQVIKLDKNGFLRWRQTIDLGNATTNQFTHPWIFADGKDLIVAANMQNADGLGSGVWFWKLSYPQRIPQIKNLNPNQPAGKKRAPRGFKVIPRR